MDFPFGQTFYRHRRAGKPDPYNPARMIPDAHGAWQTIELPGAFLGSASSVRVADGTRTQTLSDKSLFVTDVSLDVQFGDRIGSTFDPDLAEFVVDAQTSADVNPFTGFQPVREIPLKEPTG